MALAWLVLASQTAFAEPRDRWEETLDRVVPAVVALRVSATRPFDTEPSSVTVATGFVVDAERGLILTNRHVVQPGPVVAEAIFLNHERVPVHPVYRDPVHDFGVFRFDPADVRFMALVALPLAPDAARVGAEVRLVGNDAGEKLSILDGTLARLDREAPRYGRGRYNDFNTFYLQAASSSSGGSSGSPVVDRQGRVVALNAGGSRQAASSFFLPLDPVVRALAHIRAGETVPRGTLQAVFRHQSYDELRRLGLREETEARIRAERPDATGLLVVQETVPGGPAHGRLEPGDVVLDLGGRPLLGFETLARALDGTVGGEVTLSIERGGAPKELTLPVDDLHAITPSDYLEMGGAVIHALSYQVARSFAVPVGGLYVASRGYVFGRAGLPPRSLITHVDGEPVSDLDAFEKAVTARPDGARMRLRYLPLLAPKSPGVVVARVDRRWYPMQRCTRDDATGLWPCRPSEPPPPAPAPAPSTARLSAEGPRALRELARSLALVDFDVPFLVDGVQGATFSGAGLVVDADRGLVVVDRDTVPVTVGDVALIFGGAIEVPGRVVALHPDHNLALVGYDPALLGDTPVRSAVLDPRELVPGDDLWLVAMTDRQQLVSRRTEVARVDAPRIPIPRAPRFRETNAELVEVTETAKSVGGALTDDRGRVVAFWASFSRDQGGKPGAFFAGLPIGIVAEWVASVIREETVRSIGAELELLTLADARARGLPEDEAQRLEDHDPDRRRVLAVRRISADAPAAGILQVGDLLLDVAGEPVTRFREVERAVHRAGDDPLPVRVLREAQPIALSVPLHAAGNGGLDRVVAWAGALLQKPPPEVASQRGIAREGVYIAGRWSGSPADRARLRAARRIVAVDGAPVADLDAFLAAVGGRPNRSSLRLRTVDLEGRPGVQTLELDLHYWPTYELRRRDGEWTRRAVGGVPETATQQGVVEMEPKPASLPAAPN